jgi:hypothetical protein
VCCDLFLVLNRAMRWLSLVALLAGLSIAPALSRTCNETVRIAYVFSTSSIPSVGTSASVTAVERTAVAALTLEDVLNNRVAGVSVDDGLCIDLAIHPFDSTTQSILTFAQELTLDKQIVALIAAVSSSVAESLICALSGTR